MVSASFNSYFLKREDSSTRVDRNIWNKFDIPKENAFIWIVWKCRALTWDRLQTLEKKGPSRCIMCKERGEDNDHLFIHCNFIR